VDEFQDVNMSQYELVRLLAQEAELFAIGDPDQAIYGFRGSDLAYFFRLGQELQTRTINIEQNYRCGPAIVKAASTLISHNQQRSDLSLKGTNKQRSSIHYEQLNQAQDEANYIASEIDRLIGGTSSLSAGDGQYGFNDIAILMRMKRQATMFRDALHKRAIPLQQVGAQPFFMAKECRPLTLFILCGAGLGNLGDYLELFQTMEGIGRRSIEMMEQHLPLDSKLIWPILFNLELPKKVRQQLDKLVDLLSELGQADNTATSLLKACRLFRLDRKNNKVQRLLQLATALGTLSALAEHLSRSREAVIYDDRAEAISLMTLHSAKGLEFPVVFICGLEEEITPYTRAGGDIEEERRLFYVGITRAKERLYLTRAKNRHGKETVESRFIKELPPISASTAKKKKKSQKATARQLKLF